MASKLLATLLWLLLQAVPAAALGRPLVVGLTKYSHDAACCIADAVTGEILYAAAKERISRRKHDGGPVAEVIECGLASIGASLGDVRLVVSNNHHFRIGPFERRLPWAVGVGYEDPDSLHALNLLRDGGAEHLELSHHLAHAWSAAATSPFDGGVVMVMDGMGDSLENFRHVDDEVGEALRVPFHSDDALPRHASFAQQPGAFVGHGGYREAETVYCFRRDAAAAGGALRMELLFKRWSRERSPSELYNHGFENMESVGAAYSRIASHIFGDWNSCGKVMGLGPWAPTWRAQAAADRDPPGLRVLEGDLLDGSLRIDWDALRALPHVNEWKSMSRAEDRGGQLFYAELAEAMQDDLERVVLPAARGVRELACGGEGPGGVPPNLCLCGGVALNSVLNGRIQREAGFDGVFVPPFPGDDGIAIGCAMYGVQHLRASADARDAPDAPPDVPPLAPLRTPLLPFQGRRYEREELEAALADVSPWVKFTSLYAGGDGGALDEDALVAAVAEAVAGGEVVGWFQGRGEIGPRALGARSILADPRSPTMAEYLNVQVKRRETFRPFAPSALGGEHAREWFELGDGSSGFAGLASPYMSITASVREDKRHLVPSIVHIDGTARLQTVPPAAEGEWRLYGALIEAFRRLTGVPMVLNTSFNLAGEPIVEGPWDALRSFLAMEGAMAMLALEGYLVTHRSFDEAREGAGAGIAVPAGPFLSEVTAPSSGDEDALSVRVRPRALDRWIELGDELSLAVLEGVAATAEDGDGATAAELAAALEVDAEDVEARLRELYGLRLIHFSAPPS